MAGKSIQSGKKKSIWLVVAMLVLLLVIGGCVIYVNDYYHPLDSAQDALMTTVTVRTYQLEDGAWVFEPLDTEISKGMIFYPGGKVAYEAYAPLMGMLAEEGFLCVLPEMPANLAVLDMDAAKEYPGQFPQVTEWYLGGHSLGGSMAASYVAEHAQEYEGLVLLAAYSTADLKDSGLQVLSVYGSEDGVLDMEKYEEYKANLPEDFHEKIIQGGNHAYFGSYGFQDGDGEANIRNEEQLQLTVEFINSAFTKY